MTDRLVDEVRRERPDLANDPDKLHAEVECRLREVEEAIGRLNKVVDAPTWSCSSFSWSRTSAAR